MTIKIHSSSDRNIYIYNYKSGDRYCACIKFGKVKYWSDRRTNELDIYVALCGNGSLSITGDIWNATHTDVITCGQIFKDVFAVKKQLSKEGEIIVNKILWLWCNYHLQKNFSEKIGNAIQKLHSINGDIYNKPVGEEILNALAEVPEWSNDKVPEYCQSFI